MSHKQEWKQTPCAKEELSSIGISPDQSPQVRHEAAGLKIK